MSCKFDHGAEIDNWGQETFLALSAGNQTHNSDNYYKLYMYNIYHIRLVYINIYKYKSNIYIHLTSVGLQVMFTSNV